MAKKKDLPPLKFVDVSTKFKNGTNVCTLNDLFATFSRNKKVKPVTNKKILTTLFQNPESIPPYITSKPNSTLILLSASKPNSPSVAVYALVHVKGEWKKEKVKNGPHYVEGDYVICSES
jgi:hypothetical protein